MQKYRRWLIAAGVLMFLVVAWTFYYLDPFVKIAVLTLLFAGLFITVDKFGIDWAKIKLAEGDKWWSPYRMQPEPGHINIMTWGILKAGAFAMVLAGHIPGWHYYADDRRFYHEGRTKKEKAFFLTKFPGGPPAAPPEEVKVVWVGLFKRYYRRKREWIAMALKDGKHQMVPKGTTPETEHIFYFSTAMAQRVKQLSKVSTASGAPVPATLDFSYNALLINPELAEFIAGKWEEKVTGAVNSRSRIYINTKTVDELRAEKDDESNNDIIDYILRANLKQKKETGTVGLVDRFGVMIEGLFYEDFQLEEGDPEIYQAQKDVTIEALAVQKTEQTIKKEENLGIAQKKKDLQVAEGKRAIVEAFTSRPGGEVVALANSNITTLVLGERLPVAVPLPTQPPAPPTPPGASTP